MYDAYLSSIGCMYIYICLNLWMNECIFISLTLSLSLTHSLFLSLYLSLYLFLNAYKLCVCEREN